MFLFKTELILNELKKYNPSILNKCAQSMKNSVKDLDFIRIDNRYFSECPNLPIDIAVMENTDKGYVILLMQDGVILEVGIHSGIVKIRI